MQRIICRYRKDATAGSVSLGDLRKHFLNAAREAGLPIRESGRAIQTGPSLPMNATSEVEQIALDLDEPRDPRDVRHVLNLQLPQGIRVEQAWITHPGLIDENPAHLDEAVYRIRWRPAPPAGEVIERIRQFLASPAVLFTREREKKTQQLDARALVRSATVISWQDDALELQVTVSVGSQGSLRPEEFLQVLGYQPGDTEIAVRRIALRQSAWRWESKRDSSRWLRRRSAAGGNPPC